MVGFLYYSSVPSAGALISLLRSVDIRYIQEGINFQSLEQE
jgi:hypothetical protein